jgi:hypothetical protein
MRLSGWLGAILILCTVSGRDVAAQTITGPSASAPASRPVTVFRGPPSPPQQLVPPPKLRVVPGSPPVSTPTIVRGPPENQSGRWQ